MIAEATSCASRVSRIAIVLQLVLIGAILMARIVASFVDMTAPSTMSPDAMSPSETGIVVSSSR